MPGIDDVDRMFGAKGNDVHIFKISSDAPLPEQIEAAAAGVIPTRTITREELREAYPSDGDPPDPRAVRHNLPRIVPAKGRINPLNS